MVKLPRLLPHPSCDKEHRIHIKVGGSMIFLNNVEKKFGKTFSRGMKRGLTIARLFLREPKAIIMDEPTSGLDVDGKLLVRDLIKELTLTKIPMLISSHDLYELQQICNKVILILISSTLFVASSATNFKEGWKREMLDYILAMPLSPNGYVLSVSLFGALISTFFVIPSSLILALIMLLIFKGSFTIMELSFMCYYCYRMDNCLYFS